MSARKVVWSKMALKDAGMTLDYWDDHNKSPTYSNKLTELIGVTILSALTHPLAGSKTDRMNVRLRRVDNQFLLIYRIEAKQIRILRFWDTRRDVKKLKRYFK